jgi:bifunctional polynucleotide phosphatase/kinase
MENKRSTRAKPRMNNDYDTDEEKKMKRNKSNKTNIKSPEKQNIVNDIPTNDQWIKHDSVYIRDFSSIASEKILALDLDDTLIAPKGKGAHSSGENDWVILHEEKLRAKLKQFEGYKIVIFTNQKGISKGHIDVNTWKRKVEKVQEALKINFLILAATEDDYYRKPCVGMWELMGEMFNSDITPIPEKSIYVGDAAGRLKNTKGKKDHSDSDYKFALNIGCKFNTPEEFLEIVKKETIPKIAFDPKIYQKNESLTIDNVVAKEQEIIIFVGSAGSGKTSFFRNYLEPNGYVHVNQDKLKTVPKCLNVAKEALGKGLSVVIDSTNAAAKARSTFIELAKEKGIPIRCFYFKYDKDLVFHLNNLRNINKFRNHNTKSVQPVIIHTWFKNLEEPSLKEGFSEVKVFPFIPNFESENDKKVFYMYS